jgi:hypothetical protein
MTASGRPPATRRVKGHSSREIAAIICALSAGVDGITARENVSRLIDFDRDDATTAPGKERAGDSHAQQALGD